WTWAFSERRVVQDMHASSEVGVAKRRMGSRRLKTSRKILVSSRFLWQKRATDFPSFRFRTLSVPKARTHGEAMTRQNLNETARSALGWDHVLYPGGMGWKSRKTTHASIGKRVLNVVRFTRFCNSTTAICALRPPRHQSARLND
ncbi:unnamed protein product, partial [Ectocarpus sp. 13 AM-2016]